MAGGAIDGRGDFIPAEHADDLIDLRDLFQQHLAVAFCQTPGHHHGTDATFFLEVQHLADDTQRFLPGRFDEPARVHDHHIRPVGIGLQRIAILGQFPQHPLGIDQVLGAAQTDKRE